MNNAPCRCANTDTALTTVAYMEATMAKQNRSNNCALSQEPDRPITRVALYARVSTFNNQDPGMQLAELREYADRRGWQISEEYTDQGVSGSKESRPALNRLMADACRRHFDAILVWKIDRFGRWFDQAIYLSQQDYQYIVNRLEKDKLEGVDNYLESLEGIDAVFFVTKFGQVFWFVSDELKASGFGGDIRQTALSRGDGQKQ